MGEQKKVKRSEWAASRLYEMIVDEKRFRAGDKLPNENELSAELDVSRTTLREAVSYLVAHDVLVIRRGKGTFVASNVSQGGMDFSSFENLRSKVRVKDLFEMRLIFEPATAALACERATDGELEQLRRQFERVAQVAAAGGNWSAEDQALHLAITKASHNEYMRSLYHIITDAVDEIVQISPSHKELEHIALSDNEMICHFMMRRDAEGARLAMSIHMKHIIDTMQM